MIFQTCSALSLFLSNYRLLGAPTNRPHLEQKCDGRSVTEERTVIDETTLALKKTGPLEKRKTAPLAKEGKNTQKNKKILVYF